MTNGAAPQTTSSIRVLLVDDDPLIARGLSRLLTLVGHTVTIASDGGEALRLLEGSAKFDVVLSDINMPGIDGITLLRAIRGRDLDLPVVFMTGNPTLESAIAAIENGAFRYLMKPVTENMLIEAVERAAQIHMLAKVRREAGEFLHGKLLGDKAGLEVRFSSGVEKMWMAMQPVLSWRQRSVFAYEALLRTDEPALRNPVDFIEAAERLGRSAELGGLIRKWVATQCPKAPPSVSIFVNVTPEDLVDEDLCAGKDALTPFAANVVLEVTERAALDQVKGLVTSVRRLRALGYRIALDDLGAGYAALSSMVLLQPEVVKIDMSLVRDVDADPVRQKLIAMMVTLCRELRTLVVVEGVETVAERIALEALGCDLLQGFLFARPGASFPTVSW